MMNCTCESTLPGLKMCVIIYFSYKQRNLTDFVHESFICECLSCQLLFLIKGFYIMIKPMQVFWEKVINGIVKAIQILIIICNRENGLHKVLYQQSTSAPLL